MKKTATFKSIRWIAKISFIILFVIERFYSEGLSVENSSTLKYFKIAFLVTFIIASIVENKLVIKGKNKEIDTLKNKLKSYE